MSIDLFAAFAVDTEAEKNGTYTQIPGAGDTLWLVARSNNVAYQTALKKQVDRNKAVLKSEGEAARAKSNEILADVMSKTILLGWQGEIVYKGEKHKYSREVAKQLLMHADFREAVSSVSDSLEVFKAVKDEEDEKN